MAALCTTVASSASAQHAAAFHKALIAPVSVPSPPSPLQFVCHYPGPKPFLGESVSHSRRRKKCVISCTISTAVVEQDIQTRATPTPSSSSQFASDPTELQDSSSEQSVVDPLVRRPLPKPAALPKPQLRTKTNPIVVDNSQNITKRWTPKLNGTKAADGGSPVARQTFRPANKSGNSNSTVESDSAIDSLGQILEKAEKLREQNAASSQKEKEKGYTKSTWRKGVGVETPPPAHISQETTSPSSAASDVKNVRSNEGIMASGSSQQKAQMEVKKPDLLGPPLKTGPKQPQSQEGAQVLRKPGARNQGASMRPASPGVAQASRKPVIGKPLPAMAGADVLVAPVKSGKAGAIKSKDTKDDWKKKAPSSGEGLKRRIDPKENDADEVDLPGVATNARRGGRKMSKASRKAARAEAARAAAPVKADILEVGKQGMSVPDLAQKLAVNDAEIVKTLFMKGIATTVNQTLDEETVKLVCQAFDVEVVEAGSLKLEDMAKKTEFLDEDDLDSLEVRPPVVTIMGHVDHGKTSLLDFIRKSKLVASEAGGITQGIGAYTVPVTVDEQVQSCVFLDTPGHQAFTAMRARGARVTDIAIIVVAADDGVRPQTEEAIAHAKAANVPIVVAINKIDKDGAEPERVMQELSGIGLLPEDWGGDVPMVQISAVKGQNVDTLLETVMLIAELQELKANPNRSAKGTVIESCLDKTKGVLATLLVQNGTLRKGDVVLCGEAYGKIRALLDDSGSRVDVAGPSTAVQVFGLSSVPVAGSEFEVLDSLEVARDKAEQYADDARLARLAAQAAEGKVTLASLATSVAKGKDGGVERHQLNVILKVDVQGSLEAIREALNVLPQDTVNLRMLMQAAGDITISDVDLAIASEGIIVGFNVGASPPVQSYADEKGVEILLYKVIYELIDDIRSAMEGLLEVVQEQVPIGTAEVRAIFSSGSGKVAGCMVTDGKLVKGCGCKIIRGSQVIHTGSLLSLRRVKEIAKEVVAGLECGVGMENFNEWQEGDILEAFNLVAKKRTLEEASVSTTSSLAAVSVAASPSNSKSQ